MTLPALTAVPLTRSLFHGAVELEDTGRAFLAHRLPAWARARNTDAQMTMVEAQSSGVRMVLRTPATTIELDTRRSRTLYAGVPARPDGVVELVLNGEVIGHSTMTGGTTMVVDMTNGATESQVGEPHTASFAGLAPGMKTLELWLPHQEATEVLALRADAPVEPVQAARSRWVHHGSSISQGSNAARPTGTWPAVAAHAAQLDLLNLGFGGSALLDPFVARTIRDLPADVISLKLGINLVNRDLMRLRALGPSVHGFLDTIREGHPDTPLLLISPIHCGIHEDTPGPGAFDLEAIAQGTMRFTATGDPAESAAGKLTLNVIRAELVRVVQQRSSSDPNLHYLDGRVLYSEKDSAQHPLPDNLHPDATTHRFIGERFAAAAAGLGLGPFHDPADQAHHH
ncbi:lipase [Nesterenkonia sp. E16_7]|uniref:SGNH/GDSL hydrolase family protein n=1 Tax=unclassified Nesterenkonia TaxID=2629769 RepID=UPI001A9235C2|nr:MULTISPECIES: SGNH/GDSL hydrolase family protein [unclassified Nesterenkonia]MBO0594290.1 lipase [Nesterenkonia sp. E16_10]MBO0597737.1 lipase [Nesterenkonia sp. E16_7]